MRRSFWLILILSVSFIIRIYRINQLDLFGDELDVGYQAYSLWRTGRDYLGQGFPFYFHSLSEWRAPLLMYLTAPFVAIFGLNYWGVRLPSIIFGVLDILLIFFLTKSLSKDERLGLIAALILAISPWPIHYSRAAFEATLLLALILWGTLMFLKERWYWTVFAFALSLYTYNTANVFVPLWLLTLFFINRKQIKFNLRKIIGPGLVFLILAFPLVSVILRGQGAARFRLISIFSNQKTIEQIVFRRTTGLESRVLERVFHNKLTGWGKEFINNYLTAFSPQFLFLSGDPNPRHNPPGFGEFYWSLAPFLILGFLDIFREKNRVFKNLILFWLLLAPIPSSLTIGGGSQATRLFLILPPLVILTALGISRVLFSGITLVIITFLLFINSIFWFHNYFVHYPKESYQWWHYGYHQAFVWLRPREDQFERVIINNAHEPALLRYIFWTHKDPAWFRAYFHGDQERKNILPQASGFQVGRAVFIRLKTGDKIGWLQRNLQAGDVYLAFQGDEVPGDWNWKDKAPAGVKVLKIISDPWGKPLMYWLAKEADHEGI